MKKQIVFLLFLLLSIISIYFVVVVKVIGIWLAILVRENHLGILDLGIASNSMVGPFSNFRRSRPDSPSTHRARPGEVVFSQQIDCGPSRRGPRCLGGPRRVHRRLEEDRRSQIWRHSNVESIFEKFRDKLHETWLSNERRNEITKRIWNLSISSGRRAKSYSAIRRYRKCGRITGGPRRPGLPPSRHRCL